MLPSCVGAAVVGAVLAVATGGSGGVQAGTAFPQQGGPVAVIDVAVNAYIGFGPMYLTNTSSQPVVLTGATVDVSGYPKNGYSYVGRFRAQLADVGFIDDEQALTIRRLEHFYGVTLPFKPLLYQPPPAYTCLYGQSHWCGSLSSRYYLVEIFKFHRLGPLTVTGFRLLYRTRDGQRFEETVPQEYDLRVVTQAAFEHRFGRL